MTNSYFRHSDNNSDNHLHEDLLIGLDWLDQGLTLFDTDLKLRAWNRRFLELFDFPDTIPRVGTPFADFIRHNATVGEYGEGDIEEQVAKRVAKALNILTEQTEWVRSNGRILKLHGKFLPNLGYITLYTDITEQRALENVIAQHQAQLEENVRRRTHELVLANAKLREASEINSQVTEALQRSEERLRLMTDSIPAMIAYFDKNMIYRYANKGYSDWFGRRPEHLVGHSIETALGSKFFSAVEKYVRQALTGVGLNYEYSMEKENGTEVHAQTTLVPELAADQKTVLGCFVLSFDISEQKETQAALVQAQKMEAVGQLAGGLAHDFNNMLTVVIGNLSELYSRRQDDEDIQEFVTPALHAAKRGVESIRRLLSFARQHPLEPMPVNLSQLLDSMKQLLRRSIPEDIHLSIDCLDDNLIALVDPHQLENALLNLILNARDAMPNGGQLHIIAQCHQEQANKNNTKQAKNHVPADKFVKIEVRDNGLGINEQTQMRVFEPFFTTKRFGQGSGLGLASVYGFVKQSGGSISLQSLPGQGTCVTLLLPHASEAASLQKTANRLDFQGKAAGRDKPLVLLTEDDAEVRRVVRLQLTSLGYPVLEAESGEEAAQMLEHVQEIGLLLSDVVMPRQWNGRTLAEFARKIRPNLHIVLMSGHAPDRAAWLPDVSEIPLLEKPFSQEQLSIFLDEVLLCPRQSI